MRALVRSLGNSTTETSSRKRWWRTLEWWGKPPDMAVTPIWRDEKVFQLSLLPNASGRLNWFARAVVAKHHKLGGLNNGPVSSYSSGGKKSEIKMLARPCSPCRCWGRIYCRPFFQLLKASQSSIAPGTHGVLCVCVRFQIPPFYKVISHTEWGPTPFQYDQFLTNYVSVCACLIASVVSDSLWPYQAPLSMEFSRQEYWSR